MVRERRASMTREKASEKKCFAIQLALPSFSHAYARVLTRHGECVSESGNM
jgi:hypothetical protein